MTPELPRRFRETTQRLRTRHFLDGWLKPQRDWSLTLSRSGPPHLEADWSERANPDDLIAAYRLFLGRTVDDSGFRTYLPHIQAQTFSITDLASLFAASSEFRRRLAGELDQSGGGAEAVTLVDGTSFYVSPDDVTIGASIRAQKDYEPHVAARMRSILRPGQVVVDVGASIGYFTVLAAEAVGPTGQVVALEPGRQNQSILLLNVSHRGLLNVDVRSVAASDRRGFLLYSSSGGNGSVSEFDGDPLSLVSQDLVSAAPLDALLSGLDRLDAVKVDVEGAEGLVFKGARETLGRFHPKLFFEFSPPSLEATSGVTGEDLLTDLVALGYHLEVLGGDAAPGQTTSSVDAVLAAYGQAQSDHLDIFASCVEPAGS